MAKKSNYSKATNDIVKHIQKSAKKNPKGTIIGIIISIVVIALGVGGYFLYLKFNPRQTFKLNGSAVMSLKIGGDPYVEQGAVATYGDLNITDKIETTYHKDSKTGTKVDEIKVDSFAKYYVEYHVAYEKMDKTIYREVNVVDCDLMSITFLELNSWTTGDSTYIKAGDVDILIDAGAVEASGQYIVDYLNQKGRVEDYTIEYLIVTHAHSDHISGLVGNGGIFDRFSIKNIIEFGKSDQNFSSGIFKKYNDKRNNAVNYGAKLYKADKLIKDKNNVFDIAAGITMTILDQQYYRESSTENNYSVCTLFSQLDNHYLFTGDLERAGEESLVSLNNLPHCQLFKGGHHGSGTSNNDCLLNKITPEVVCICCCAGSTEYTSEPLNSFPYQEVINRLAKHTDKIYVTTVSTDNKKHTFKSMNGNITFLCENGKDYFVHGSNNDTILKNTTWFKNNRTWPSKTA